MSQTAVKLLSKNHSNAMHLPMPRTFMECQDLDWYARDSLGHLAVFASGGTRYVPPCYHKHIQMAFDVKARVDQLPLLGAHRILNGSPSTWRNASWTDAAERGLYGFDYDVENGSGYELFVEPTVPLTLDVNSAPWIRCMPVYPDVFGIPVSLIKPEPVLHWELEPDDTP